jgi:hypothetical protein
MVFTQYIQCVFDAGHIWRQFHMMREQHVVVYSSDNKTSCVGHDASENKGVMRHHTENKIKQARESPMSVGLTKNGGGREFLKSNVRNHPSHSAAAATRPLASSISNFPAVTS